jgi:hypothetical protein
MAMAMHTRIAHPLPGHCRSLPLRLQLFFIAIAVALLIACGRFCLSRNPMSCNHMLYCPHQQELLQPDNATLMEGYAETTATMRT